ncbi:hypothetical protein [Sorangium sp. So ce394]|uniref:hypothetical protein n=1 Tax=Sorangium sp. So ce394 TaxID=3133310 RepID=UPI003F5BE93D
MSNEVLGDLNAACARGDDEATERIAELVGLTLRAVQKRLHEAHGATLVRNVFFDAWPATAGAFAEMRVKQAREAGLFPEIARVTGLAERAVRRRLEGAHGKGFLQNLFSDAWPSEEGEDDAPASDDEADHDLVAIGTLTAARARRDEDVVQRIAVLTGHSVRSVQRRLEEARGATRVRKLFREWPTDPQRLGDLRVKLARECGLFPEIAAVTHQSEQTIIDWLMQGDGRSAVRNLFGYVWPSRGPGGKEPDEEEDGDEEEDSDKSEDGAESEDDGDEEDGDQDEDEEEDSDEDEDGNEDEDNGDEENLVARFRLDPGGAWSRRVRCRCTSSTSPSPRMAQAPASPLRWRCSRRRRCGRSGGPWR